jgi:hypothetical protein
VLKLPASRAHLVRRVLGLRPPITMQAYYRDVYIWLPDMQYGAMPPCPSCSSADDVGAHGWRDNHICRRVCGLDTSYFVISRRYVCRTCRRAADARRAEAASALGLSVVDDLEAEALEGTPRAGRGSGRADAEGAEEELLGAYTFMAWHPRSLRLLPYGLGGRFPAFLTHRAAVDKSLIDLMRPLFDKGVRPEAFSSTLLELHAKRYWQLHLLHEERYAREKAQPSISLSLNARAAPPPFSTFGDKAGTLAPCRLAATWRRSTWTTAPRSPPTWTTR